MSKSSLQGSKVVRATQPAWQGQAQPIDQDLLCGIRFHYATQADGARLACLALSRQDNVATFDLGELSELPSAAPAPAAPTPEAAAPTTSARPKKEHAKTSSKRIATAPAPIAPAEVAPTAIPPQSAAAAAPVLPPKPKDPLPQQSQEQDWRRSRRLPP